MGKAEQLVKVRIKDLYGSVAQFSRETGIPYSTINNLFTRGFGGSGLETIAPICKALDINLNALLEKEEDKVTEMFLNSWWENFGPNIRYLRRKRNTTKEELADAIGVSVKTIGYWERGRSYPVISDVVDQVAGFFGLNFIDLIEKELWEDDIGQGLLDPNYTDVPLYDSLVADVSREMITDYQLFPVPHVKVDQYPDSFLLKVKGESMNKRLPNGCYALINPSTEPVDGKVHALCVNGHEAIIKRVRLLENGMGLVPDSTDPTFKPQLFDFGEEGTEAITIIGRVVYHVMPFDYDY